MSVPASPHGSLAAPPSPLRTGMGIVTFAFGLLVTFGLVVYAAWLAMAALTAVQGVSRHVGGTVVGSPGHSSPGHGSPGHGSPGHSAAKDIATAPPVAARTLPATPSGATLSFDQPWTSHDGNTIVAGAPTVGSSARTGEPVIRVPVTLTNNSEQTWNPMSTTFVGKLNHATVPESTEGDWMYSTPIVAHTSVTLTKVFVAGPGQFTLTMDTPQGGASFTG